MLVPCTRTYNISSCKTVRKLIDGKHAYKLPHWDRLAACHGENQTLSKLHTTPGQSLTRITSARFYSKRMDTAHAAERHATQGRAAPTVGHMCGVVGCTPRPPHHESAPLARLASASESDAFGFAAGAGAGVFRLDSCCACVMERGSRGPSGHFGRTSTCKSMSSADASLLAIGNTCSMKIVKRGIQKNL